MKRTFLIVVLVMAIVFLGWAIPRWVIGAGIEKYSQDRERYNVAAEAYDRTLQLQESPIERILIPGVRITRVDHEPGHCPPGEPGSAEPLADYTASVRLYGWFGIPAGRAGFANWKR